MSPLPVVRAAAPPATVGEAVDAPMHDIRTGTDPTVPAEPVEPVEPVKVAPAERPEPVPAGVPPVGAGRAAPATAAAAGHGPGLPVGAQVGLYLRQVAHDRVERLVVRLEPEELGRVEVRLDFGRDGRVSALIAADRPETLEALQRDARGLERALQDAGLRPGDHGLSFSLRREGGGGGHHAGRDDGPPGWSGGRPAPDDEPRPAPAYAAAHGLRLLDINA